VATPVTASVFLVQANDGRVTVSAVDVIVVGDVMYPANDDLAARGRREDVRVPAGCDGAAVPVTTVSGACRDAADAAGATTNAYRKVTVAEERTIRHNAGARFMARLPLFGGERYRGIVSPEHARY